MAQALLIYSNLFWTNQQSLNADASKNAVPGDIKAAAASVQNLSEASDALNAGPSRYCHSMKEKV